MCAWQIKASWYLFIFVRVLSEATREDWVWSLESLCVKVFPEKIKISGKIFKKYIWFLFFSGNQEIKGGARPGLGYPERRDDSQFFPKCNQVIPQFSSFSDPHKLRYLLGKHREPHTSSTLHTPFIRWRIVGNHARKHTHTHIIVHN